MIDKRLSFRLACLKLAAILQQELVILGGAFFCNGNVSPCAEANIIADTEAADFVLGQSPNIRMVGLDVTHKCVMHREQLDALKGQGKYGTFLHQICQFYLQYHRCAIPSGHP